MFLWNVSFNTIQYFHEHIRGLVKKFPHLSLISSLRNITIPFKLFPVTHFFQRHFHCWRHVENPSSWTFCSSFSDFWHICSIVSNIRPFRRGELGKQKKNRQRPNQENTVVAITSAEWGIAFSWRNTQSPLCQNLALFLRWLSHNNSR